MAVPVWVAATPAWESAAPALGIQAADGPYGRLAGGLSASPVVPLAGARPSKALRLDVEAPLDLDV